MFRSSVPCLSFVLSLGSLLGVALRAQEPTPAPVAPPLRVEVPTFPNQTCPIMGKKVSMPLFVDTEAGRFYVCCKPCFKKILANVEAAYKTAYPTTRAIANQVCPVSGEPIGDDAATVVLQGYSFRVCCAGCVGPARTHAQVTLTKLLRQDVVDVGNATCPVRGGPVAKNAFALVGNSLVHLSSPGLVEAVEKEPAKVLQKARELAASQPPQPKHVHTKAPAAPATGEAEAGK